MNETKLNVCDEFLKKLIDNMNNLDFGYHVQSVSNRQMTTILGDTVARTNRDLSKKHNNTYIALDLFKNRWKKKCFIITKNVQTIYVEFNYIEKEDQSSIKHILNFLMIYLFQIESIFEKKCDNFRVIFYLSSDKKVFQKNAILKQDIITCDNVNSGVTIYYHDVPLIVVYRKEELLKVLIHELLHLHEIHPIEQYDTYYDDHCKNTWKIARSGSLNLYESYVEVFSVVIHSFIYAYCIHKKKTNVIHIKRVLDKERKYSNHLLNDIISLQEDNYLHEETNVFSYFYVKTALFQNLDLFFSSIDPHNYCIHDKFEHEYLESVLDCLALLKPSKKNIKNIKRTHFRMTISDVIT